MSQKASPEIVAIVVAAGTGSRMGGSSPKQYLQIQGRSMLDLSVSAILEEPRINKLVIVISPADIVGQRLKFEDPRVEVARVGGNTRSDSVRNGLAFCASSKDDWVLVHDAARPCLLTSDVSKLIDHCLENNRGAILAVPVNDTLKKAKDGNEIDKTVPRDDLWRAQTPQCFKYGELLKALNNPNEKPTDEASAMEKAGYPVDIVEGSSTNIKVTRPMDLWLVKAIFQYRAAGEDRGSD